jgi:hypothetical protein
MPYQIQTNLNFIIIKILTLKDHTISIISDIITAISLILFYNIKSYFYYKKIRSSNNDNTAYKSVEAGDDRDNNL